jgi:hypothetical protein
MKDEILEYIREHVKVWPIGTTEVRLDKDGEICFGGRRDSTFYDFTPMEGFKGEYKGDTSTSRLCIIGNNYTHSQWYDTSQDVKGKTFERTTDTIYAHIENNAEAQRRFMLLVAQANPLLYSPIKELVEEWNKISHEIAEDFNQGDDK